MVVAPWCFLKYRCMQRSKSKTIAVRGSEFPPPFIASLVVKKRVRFQANAGGLYSIAPVNIGDLYCVPATATTAYQLADFVRVRKVEMWGPQTSSLSPVTLYLEWAGNNTPGMFGRSTRLSDTSMAAGSPAHIVARPPPSSQISEWLSGVNTSAFMFLQCPTGTVIDLTYEFVMRDNGTAVQVTGAVAGATVGAVCLRALDSASGTSNLVPTAVATI